MQAEYGSNFFNNRKKLLVEQWNHWKNNWMNGVVRLVERILSGGNVSDLLAGNGTQIAHLSKDQQKLIQKISLLTPGEAGPVFTVRRIESPEILELQVVTQPQYLLELNNVNVDILTGLPQLPMKFLINDVLAHWQRLMYRGGMTHSLRRLSKNKKFEPGTWIVLPYSPFYFHTLIEELPLLIKGSKVSENLKVAVVRQTPKWALELLACVGLETVRFSEKALKFEKYFAVTAPRGISPGDIQILRSSFKIENSGAAKKRILISRGTLDRANLELERSIFNLLESHNFQIIDPSTLSVREQIKLFSTAELIVGFHGGALTNMLWARPGTHILEVFNHPYRTHDFARLAQACGHNYNSAEIYKLDGLKEIIASFIATTGINHG